MTQPLAIVLYEKLLPGSQLVTRLQDLTYRVDTINDASTLTSWSVKTGPMVVLADLESTQANICAAIAQLKQNPATRHIPVVAFVDEVTAELEAAARQSGAMLVASDAAVVNLLPEILQQALQVE